MKLFLPLCFLFSVAAGADTKPNILWIIAEDMGPELSCYGTPGVYTPTLDSIAKNGVLYKNAFTVTPVCSTSRSAFHTGMYAQAIGAHHHRSNRDGKHLLPEGVELITDTFRKAGYFTGNLSKLTDDPEEARFYKGTGKTDWNFTYSEDGSKKPFDTNKWSDLKGNQPWFAEVNFSETHRGGAWNVAHEHIAKKADPAKVVPPPYYPDHEVTRAVWAQYLNAVMAVDKKVSFILNKLRAEGMGNDTVVFFFGDHGRAMPRGKQFAYDSGLRVPLIIYWPKDNRVLSVPKLYERGKVDERLIASIDITATSLAMAGIEKPEAMQGRVFLGRFAEANRRMVFGGRDRGDETVDRVRTVRTKQYRYVRNYYPGKPLFQLNRYKENSYPILGLMRKMQAEGTLTGAPAALMAEYRMHEELYDVEKDPWETKNLAQDPAYADVVKRLSGSVSRWIEDIDDAGVWPEDPGEVKKWEDAMKKAYDGKMRGRGEGWFEKSPALGDYR